MLSSTRTADFLLHDDLDESRGSIRVRFLAAATVGKFRCASGIATIFGLVGAARQCFSSRTDADGRRPAEEIPTGREFYGGLRSGRSPVQGLLGILLGGEPCQPNTSSMAVASASPQSSSWGSAKRVTARRISEPA